MPSLPAVYQACCYAEPGQNKVKIREDMPLPEPGAGEVLVSLYVMRICQGEAAPQLRKPQWRKLTRSLRIRTHSGVCHSDYDIMMNALALPAQP